MQEQMNAAGNRKNGGKPRWTLLLKHMAPALEAVVRVAEHGAEKYSRNGWWDNPLDAEETLDSMQRHVLAMMRGEQHDPVVAGGSGLPHWAHVAWNALALGSLSLAARLPSKQVDGGAGSISYGFTLYEDARDAEPVGEGGPWRVEERTSVDTWIPCAESNWCGEVYSSLSDVRGAIRASRYRDAELRLIDYKGATWQVPRGWYPAAHRLHAEGDQWRVQELTRVDHRWLPCAGSDWCGEVYSSLSDAREAIRASRYRDATLRLVGLGGTTWPVPRGWYPVGHCLYAEGDQ